MFVIVFSQKDMQKLVNICAWLFVMLQNGLKTWMFLKLLSLISMLSFLCKNIMRLTGTNMISKLHCKEQKQDFILLSYMEVVLKEILYLTLCIRIDSSVIYITLIVYRVIFQEVTSIYSFYLCMQI